MTSGFNWKKEFNPLAIIVIAFFACYYMPVEKIPFSNFITESLFLVQDYAREHVLLCLIPAMFIAGAIAVFISRDSVMKYLGADANKVLAYGVASVSGTILAVCSCTILPLFAGIYRMGAGIGPASAFLYAGPAINVLAILLTARVLGVELGIARAVGAILFSVLIGLGMHLIFHNEQEENNKPKMVLPDDEASRPLVQSGLFFFTMVAILIFANWGKPQSDTGLWSVIYSAKWIITSAAGVILALILVGWFELKWWKIAIVSVISLILALAFPAYPVIAFSAAFIGLSVITSTGKGEMSEWFSQSWWLTKQILPLLLIGVLIAGALLGRPESEGLIPSEWISKLVGGNGFFATLFASVAGAFMYFATLTEVPILEGLIGNGMGKGPALALLLAGPALSLPNMLVIRSIMGTRKTVVFVCLVIIAATAAGLLYGSLF